MDLDVDLEVHLDVEFIEKCRTVVKFEDLDVHLDVEISEKLELPSSLNIRMCTWTSKSLKSVKQSTSLSDPRRILNLLSRS